MRISVYGKALAKEYFAVTAFFTAYEKNEVVFCGKRTDVRNAVGNLSADRVEVMKLCWLLYVFFYLTDYRTKALK